MTNGTRLSDFSKSAILDCYRLVKNYLHDDDVESEECFAKMWAEMEINKISIPAEIYNMIDEYVDNYIAPIVYDHENTFAMSNHEEDLLEVASHDPDSPLNDKDYWMYCNFMITLSEIETAFDEFAMENLYPLLTA